MNCELHKIGDGRVMNKWKVIIVKILEYSNWGCHIKCFFNKLIILVIICQLSINCMVWVFHESTSLINITIYFLLNENFVNTFIAINNYIRNLKRQPIQHFTLQLAHEFSCDKLERIFCVQVIYEGKIKNHNGMNECNLIEPNFIKIQFLIHL